MTDYQRIDCGLHSQYELAIMHRRTIYLCWQDANGATYDEVLLAIDLITRNGEEFLIAKTNNGTQRKIRLDRIIKHNL